MKVLVLLPCYNDAPTALELIHEVGVSLRGEGHDVNFVVVDDGSSPPIRSSGGFDDPSILVLELKRNLGHQRGIACGLCHVASMEKMPDALVVMDSDGEDRPEDVAKLVSRITLDAEPRVVFAGRAQRSESLRFRIFYKLYLAMHAALIGHAPRVGNFTAVDARLLPGLVTDADLWSHYAATLWKTNWQRTLVPLDRGKRRRGSSKLNFTGLVLHGITAISCYWEKISLRLMFFHAAMFFLCLMGFAGLALAQALGWVCSCESLSLLRDSLGLASAAFFVLMVLGLGDCLRVLNRRNQMSVLPVRDYRNFIKS